MHQAHGSTARLRLPHAVIIAVGTIGVAILGAVVGGCESHGKMAIPSSAEMLTSGDGRDIVRATTAYRGRAWVRDRDADRILWSGDVDMGDKIIIDPTRNIVQKNKDTVSEPQMKPGHRYEIYFDREDRD